MNVGKISWFSLCKSILKNMWMLCLAILLFAVLITLIPQIIGIEVVRDITASIILSDKNGLILSLHLLIISTIICVISNILFRLFVFKVRKKLIIELEDKAIESYGNLANWNESIPTGEVISRIRQNSTQVSNLFINSGIAMIMVLISFVGVSIYVFTINAVSLLICLLTAGILVFLSRKSLLSIQTLGKVFSESYDKLYANSWEHLSNMEVIPFLSKAKIFKHYYNHVHNLSDAQIKFNRAKSLSYLFNRFGSIGIILITALLGAYLISNGILHVADVLALIMALPIISESVFKIPSYLAEWNELRGLGGKLDDIYGLQSYDYSGMKDVALTSLNEIDVDINSFSYSKENEALFRNVKISISGGDFLCISGPSGCGKTSLLRMMAGLIGLYDGKIKLNEKDITQISRDRMWAKIGYVEQEAVILNDSILNNIVLYEQEIDYKKLEAAVQAAQLSQFVRENLPDGLQTIINAHTLSSGEMQKISLARIFYRDPDVYLLDESTSHIDHESEQNIITYLQEISVEKEKIVVLVTHNTAIVDRSEKVYMF